MARKTKMNSLTSPELIAAVNPDNIRLKDDFISYMRSVQRSPATCAGYESDLLIFFVWVLQHAGNKPFAKISKRDLIAYQNWLVSDNGNSPARVRRLKAAISSLSNFVESILDEEPEYEGFRSIVKKIENPVNHPVREKTVWEDDELDALLRSLVDAGRFEQACYLALGMYSGRRKSELARFRVSDFYDDRLVCDGALYKSAPIKTKGRGGGKYIPCYTLAKKFKPYLDLWVKQRCADGIESEWLFPDKSNPKEHIQISTLNSWADTFTRMSGRDFYAHSLRHYFSTYLAKAGIPDSVIQTIVAWESSDMVRLYKDIDPDSEIGMYFKDGEIAAKPAKSFSEI